MQKLKISYRGGDEPSSKVRETTAVSRNIAIATPSTIRSFIFSAYKFILKMRKNYQSNCYLIVYERDRTERTVQKNKEMEL